MIEGPIENLWLFESSPSFGWGGGAALNSPGGGVGAMGFAGLKYLSLPQQARAERIRQATMLFLGRHREYFLGERRTQFEFPPMQAGDITLTPYVKFNVLKLVSLKIADLLFGEEPLISCDDEIQQSKLTDLLDRSSFAELLKTTAVESTYEAEAFLEACIYQGQVHIQRIPAREIFPIGSLMPDRQYASYQRFRSKNIGTDEAPLWVLLITTYAAGSITRALWQIDKDGQKQKPIDLENWNKVDPEPEALAEEVKTGLTDNTITWVPNDIVHDCPVSTYDGLIELQDALNAKQTQLARVIAIHSDPAMAIPEEAFDAQGNVRSKYKAVPFRDPNVIPKYITWNAELDAATKDRSFTLNALLILAEMSPSLLGLKEGASPDAWKKLRLEANNAISMAKRKATTWRSRIKRLLGVAQALEQTIPGSRYDMQPITVQPQDGLPVDDLDQAQTISLLMSAGAMSPERAVELQIPDKAGQEKEIERIKSEAAAKAAAATPSIFMGNPTPDGQEATTEAGAGGPGAGSEPAGEETTAADDAAELEAA